MPGRILVLARKEIRSWVYAPVLYCITVFFILFVSIWFFYFRRFFSMNTATLRPFFEAFPPAFIPVIPILTMKAWAEEKRSGSIELLVTLPFSEWELVLGKFISCFFLLFIMMILTLPVPLTLLLVGHFDVRIIITEYIGSLLLGSSAIAIGLFFSSVSKTQAASFLGSASVLLVMNLVYKLDMPQGLAVFFNFISLPFHFESFSRGILDSRDIAFFLLTASGFLFLNTRVLIFGKYS